MDFLRRKEKDKMLYNYKDVPTITLCGYNNDTKEWEILMEDVDYVRYIVANVSSQENKTSYVLSWRANRFSLYFKLI